MKKEKQGNSIPGSFTAVSHTLKNGGLFSYEMIIVSEIQSWNRQDKKFYASILNLAKDYGYDRKVIIKGFNFLVDQKIITKGKKVYNNQHEYKLDVNTLMLFIKKFKEANITITKYRKQLLNTSCTTGVQLDDQAVPPGASCCTTGVQNKKPKNINKNILRGEEETLGVSSHPDPNDQVALNDFLKSLQEYEN